MTRPDSRRRSISISVLALMAAGVCACGSGGKTSSGPKLDPAFAKRIDAVCTRQLAQLNAHGAFPYPQFKSLHPDPKLLPRVGVFLERLQPPAQAVPGQLRALGEPTSARAAWDHVRSQIAFGKAITTRQIASAKASDAAGFAAESKTANSLHDQIIAELQGLGLAKSSACSQVV
jgi:hypothetical protein